MVATDGPIGSAAGSRQQYMGVGERRRHERMLAAVRLLAFVVATSFAVATVVAIVLAVLLQRLAALGG